MAGGEDRAQYLAVSRNAAQPERVNSRLRPARTPHPHGARTAGIRIPMVGSCTAGTGTVDGRRRTDESMTDLELPDTAEELSRLRAENERLRAIVARDAPPDGRPRRRRRVGRWTFATICLLVGCLL